jgi:Uma2 family endonuclease
MPIVVPQIDATIPDGITDLDAFRRWAKSDDFPRRGRFAFLNGNVWMDLTMEQAFSHNQVKGAINAVLTLLVEREDVGMHFPDGMLLSNPDAGLSTVPDGVFVSHEAFETGAARGIEGATEGDFIELTGSPDMVLEVVSKSSEEKDTVDLPDVYWRAGISEYWLVDARQDPIRFDLLRRGARGYTPTRPAAGGWRKSAVFGRSFRLVRKVDRAGNPKYILEAR